MKRVAEGRRNGGREIGEKRSLYSWTVRTSRFLGEN